MEVLDICLVRQAILPSTILTAMVFQMMKVLKCIRVMSDVYIGLLRPATIHLTIEEFIIVVTMIEVDLGLKSPATLPISILEFIILVTMLEVDIGLKIPAILHLKIPG